MVASVSLESVGSPEGVGSLEGVGFLEMGQHP